MKLLIADDEDYTREGLLEGIAWEKLGMEEVLQAENGHMALSISKWYQPDVILTDIKMPKMDGIEFAKELLRISPETKIIFMSGYMEIDYLKSAIKLSAVDYIEKPIDLKMVEKAVLRAVEELAEKRNHREVLADKQYLEGQKLLAVLSDKHGDTETMQRLCKSVGFPMNKNYVCVILSDRENQLFGDMALNSLKKVIDKRGFASLLRLYGDGQYQIVIAFDKEENYRLPGLYQELIAQIQGAILGVGFEVEDIRNVHNSVQTAVLAINSSFFEETAKICTVDESIFQKRMIEPGIYGDFLQMLTEKPMEVRLWCKNFFAQLKEQKNYRKEQVQALATSFVWSIAKEYPVVVVQYAMLGSEDMVEHYVQNFATLKDMWLFIDEVLLCMENNCNIKSRYSRLICDIIAYIEGNYHLTEMTVAMIAEVFHLTPAYVNVLFKQETGQTLKKYISSVRLERAKALLRSEYNRINEIAENCGYANANYFSKVFREETGMTPLEYRNTIALEEES